MKPDKISMRDEDIPSVMDIWKKRKKRKKGETSDFDNLKEKYSSFKERRIAKKKRKKYKLKAQLLQRSDRYDNR